VTIDWNMTPCSLADPNAKLHAVASGRAVIFILKVLQADIETAT
jgi:hypothetical protein